MAQTQALVHSPHFFRKGPKRTTEIQRIISKVQGDCKALEQLNETIKSKSQITTSSFFRNTLARIANFVLPRRMQEILPAKVAAFIAEETDILEYIANKKREYANNLQENIVNLSAARKHEKEELEQLDQDIQRATDEHWDASQLQAFIYQKARFAPNLDDDDDTDDDIQTPEHQESRRKLLLQRLTWFRDQKASMIKFLGTVRAGAKDIISVAILDEYVYSETIPSIIAARDGTKAVAQTNSAIFAGQEAIQATLNATIEGMHSGLDVLKLLDAPEITRETRMLLEAGQEKLQAKMHAIETHLINSARALPEAPTVITVEALDVVS